MTMSLIEARPYDVAQAEAWDLLCAMASASFLHTRRFLAYHGTRFEDASVLLFKQGRMVGVVPAARLPTEPSVIVSHPGATFGGVVHDGALAGNDMLAAFDALAVHWRGLGARELVYKAVPAIQQKRPSQDDLYALFRRGAKRSRCELSSAIDLTDRRTPSERRRRALKKSRAQVQLDDGWHCWPALHALIAENLASRHGAVPVHRVEEIEHLHSCFPDRIQLLCARLDGEVAAGVLLFNGSTVWHAQYIASNGRGFEVSALDAVIEQLIEAARGAGARWFDFGTSNEDSGRVLNDGLYRFKSEFGGGGVVHEQYMLSL